MLNVSPDITKELLSASPAPATSEYVGSWPSSILFWAVMFPTMLVPLLTGSPTTAYHGPRFRLKLVAPWNICVMLVAWETFHPDMSPLKEAAPWNMNAMLATPDRSGASVAAYVTLVAPLNADSMDVHDVVPHCIMCVSFWALPADKSASRIRVISPDMDTL